jgi:WD40 repeat protein
MWRDTSLFGCEQSLGQRLAACPCSDGVVHIVSLQGNALEQIRTLNVAKDLRTVAMCMTATFSLDGKSLAVATSAHTISVYDTAKWAMYTQFELDHNVRSCSWNQEVCCFASHPLRCA